MRSSRTAALFALAAVISGCGYSLVTADAVPEDLEMLYLARVEVGEVDPLLGDALGRELRLIVRREGHFSLVRSASSADAVLRVQITTDRSRAVAFDEFDDVLDYEATISADATLKRDDGSVLWAREGISASRGHAAVAEAVVETSSAFQSQERLERDDLNAFNGVQIGRERRAEARDRLVADLASTIYVLITEGI